MLISTDDIRRVRPVAMNVQDKARVEPYIREVERLRIIPALGASLFALLDSLQGNIPDEGVDWEKDSGETVHIEAVTLATLLNGGYYKSRCCKGVTTVCPGLKETEAYLTYHKFLTNNEMNATAFGVVYKDGDFSTKADTEAVSRQSAEARNVGDAYLRECVKYLHAVGLLEEPCCEKPKSKDPARDCKIQSPKL